jgi:L-erythro-3,5-diaminohexanoate dehydrogenase
LIVAAAARHAGVPVVIGVESHAGAAADAESLGLFDRVLRVDATDALLVAESATAAVGGEYDLVISCVSAPRAEMAAILPTRQGGTVYFFSMATSFTAAALGAEGVSKDIDMLIGNGYCTGHADETLALLREHKPLRELFIRRYG